MSMKDFVDTLNEEQKKALLEALSGKETDNDTKEQSLEDNITEDFRVVKNNNSPLSRGRQQVKAGPNTWSDTGEDRHIKTPEIKATPRNRKPPKKKNVTCYVCGKKNSVNANLIYGEFYRCDNCIGG